MIFCLIPAINTNSHTNISPCFPLFFLWWSPFSSFGLHDRALLAATPSPVVFCHNDVQEGKKMYPPLLFLSCPHTSMWADWSTIWLHRHLAKDRVILRVSKEGWGAVINRDSLDSYAPPYEWNQHSYMVVVLILSVHCVLLSLDHVLHCDFPQDLHPCEHMSPITH